MNHHSPTLAIDLEQGGSKQRRCSRSFCLHALWVYEFSLFFLLLSEYHKQHNVDTKIFMQSSTFTNARSFKRKHSLFRLNAIWMNERLHHIPKEWNMIRFAKTDVSLQHWFFPPFLTWRSNCNIYFPSSSHVLFTKYFLSCGSLQRNKQCSYVLYPS